MSIHNHIQNLMQPSSPMHEYGSVESLIRSALGSRFNEQKGLGTPISPDPMPQQTNQNFNVNEMVAGYPDMSAFNKKESNTETIRKKYVFTKDIEGMFDCKVTVNVEITPKK